MKATAAFPLVAERVENHPSWYSNEGMTLRDWFAGQAMAGWLASFSGTDTEPDPTSIAGFAYALADEMILMRTVERQS